MIGLAALAAMAAPYLTRAFVDSRAVEGKVQVFEGQSQREQKELVLCLIKRGGALNVEVTSHDFYTDPANGLALRVVDQGAAREVRAWLPKGQALSAAQLEQLNGCVR